MKNKKMYIIGGAVLLVAVIGFFVWKSNSKKEISVTSKDTAGNDTGGFKITSIGIG